MISKYQRVLLRRFHRWFGIVIGIQLLFWIGSGVYFAWMPIKVVKDQDRKLEIRNDELDINRFVPPSYLSLPADFKIKALNLEVSARGPIYRLDALDGRRLIFAAISGELLPLIRSSDVESIALAQTLTRSPKPEVTLLSETEGEYKGAVPVYKIVLDDFRHTRLYVDPWTGKVLASRNMFWRIYDFLWMMHIMDFDQREDFNNLLLRCVSLGALCFLGTGYLLFYFGRPPKRR